MGIKIVLLLLFAICVESKLIRDRQFVDYINKDSKIARSSYPVGECDEGQYYSEKFNACQKCTICGEFMYQIEECQENSNTKCGWCGNLKDSDFNDDYKRMCLESHLAFVDYSRMSKKIGEKLERKMETMDAIEMENMILPYDDSESDLDEQIAEHIRRKFDEEPEGFGDDEELEPLPIESMEDDEEEDESEQEYDDTEEVLPLNDSNEVAEVEDEGYLLQPVDFDPYFPHEKGFNAEDSKKTRIVSMEAVENALREHEEYKMDRVRDDENMDSEENEVKFSRFDTWVDDRVKPIAVRTFELKGVVEADSEEDSGSVEQIVLKMEAEEIQDEEAQNMYFVVEAEKIRDNAQNLLKSVRASNMIIIKIVAIVIFATCLIVYLRILRRRENVRNMPFVGVPTDSEDYHMIIEGGKYVEEQEKKCAKHVHENPLFEV